MIRKFLIILSLGAVLTVGLACNNSQAAEPAGNTWLSPGEIQIGNLSPGDKIKQMIKIHNGSEKTATFAVYYRIPDYVETGFISAPSHAVEWISIAEDSPVLAPEETKEVQVILDLPEQVQIPERWEFWIGVKENKGNTLSTELCSRWLVTMRR